MVEITELLRRYAAPPPNCAWCGLTGKRDIRRTPDWPYVCSECLEPVAHYVGRFRAHRVPQEMVRNFALNPSCASCGADIGGRYASGKVRAYVDHDHACCAGSRSCGKCVRGIVCVSCNTLDSLIAVPSQGDPEVVCRIDGCPRTVAALLADGSHVCWWHERGIKVAVVARMEANGQMRAVFAAA